MFVAVIYASKISFECFVVVFSFLNKRTEFLHCWFYSAEDCTLQRVEAKSLHTLSQMSAFSINQVCCQVYGVMMANSD